MPIPGSEPQDLRETMVERVAQRLGDMFQPGKTVTAREMARAAIAAMREPTEAMLEANIDAISTYVAGSIYRKMLDAALAEPSGKDRGGK